MRTSLVCLACLALVMAAGCEMTNHMKTAEPTQAFKTVKGKDINVSIRLPKRDWNIGDTIPVEVTALNTTGQTVDIASPTGAPVLVRLLRPSKGSFEQVHVYPKSATSNIVNWTLPAHKARTFKMLIDVEPDWPVAEVLKLSAELNGYPQYSPSVIVTIHSKEQ